MPHPNHRSIDLLTVLFLMSQLVLTTSVLAHDGDPVAAVRSLLDRQMADWNKQDLDGFLAGYWNSPKLTFQSGGNRVHGWQTIRDRYRARYQAAGRSMGTLQFSELEIEPLAADVALAKGQWQVTMHGGSQPHGLFTLILKRFPDGWKIIHDHTSAADPAVTPAPSSEKK